MNRSNSPSTLNGRVWFVFHLAITLLAWVGPFLFDWRLMITAYTLVMLQFLVFNRCLVNNKHNLSEDENMTFYAYLFEQLGVSFSRKKVKTVVRIWLYPAFGIIAYFFQVVLGFEPVFYLAFNSK